MSPTCLRWLPLLALGACTPSSLLTLTLNVDGDVLRQVEDFPVQVLVDFANGESLLALQLCSFGGEDFVEATLEAETYKGCRGPTTVSAVVVPLETACETGRVNRAVDAFPAEDAWYGYGERVVFDSNVCGVEQDAVLGIDPF